jgi:predicted MFS family arabinose efflux permease
VRGLSITEFGLLQALYYTTAVVLEVPSGVIADRWGRKGTLVAGALLAALGSLLRVFAESFPVFAAAEICFASSLALTSGADSAIVYDSLAGEGREDEYARAEGAGQASWLAATGLGLPLTDLLLVRNGDPVLAFVATGVLALVGGGCALMMKEPPRGERQSALEITAGAVRDVVRIPGILRLLMYSAGVFLLLRAAIILFFNPSLEQAGIPVNLYGTVLAAVNIVGAAAAWQSHRVLEAIGERRFLFLMPTAMILMYALLIPAGTPWVVGIFCIQGAVLGAYPVVIRTILNRRVASPARRATTLSFESMACRLVYALGVMGIATSLEVGGLAIALAVTPLLGGILLLSMRLLPRSPD